MVKFYEKFKFYVGFDHYLDSWCVLAISSKIRKKIKYFLYTRKLWYEHFTPAFDYTITFVNSQNINPDESYTKIEFVWFAYFQIYIQYYSVSLNERYLQNLLSSKDI